MQEKTKKILIVVAVILAVPLACCGTIVGNSAPRSSHALR